MKTLWNMLGAVSFLNLMAILAGVGWLLNSGRLDQKRVVEVSQLLGETVAERDARVAAEQAAAAASKAGIGEDGLPDRPPLPAEDQLKFRVLDSAADRQRIERLRQEVIDLQATLARERRLLDEQRANLDIGRAEYERMRARIAQTEGQEQFRRAVKVLQELRPSAARDTLSALLTEGKFEEVVGYLNALPDEARSAIVGEYVKGGQAELAGRLLEAIRLRGVEVAEDLASAGGAPAP